MTAQPKKLFWRLFWVALLVVVVAAVAAPFLSAERFSARIRAGLVSSLGRDVEFREPRFILFRGPGFTVKDVVVHEDASFGIEPIAYVRSLEARVDLASLLSGRLVFSNLRLIEPSITLARNEAGVWNSQLFFRGSAASGNTRGASWPTIQVRDGRVNVKLGEWKSVYYFSEADMDVYPQSGAGAGLVLRFAGVPARTDRASQSFGTMRGRLRWLPGQGEGRLEAEAELERSSLGELMILAHGEDVGVHGAVSGNVRLAGPLSAIAIAGQLDIDSLYRWDLSPGKITGGPLRFRGMFSASDQRLELDADQTDNPNMRMALRLRVADLLGAPRWAVSLTALDMPLAPVVETVGHLGLPLSKDVVTGGNMTGVMVYSPESSLRGQFLMDAVALQLPGKVAAQLEQARVVASGAEFQLPVATMRFDNAAVLVDGDYDRGTRALNLRFNARALPIATLENALGGTIPVPLSNLVASAGEGMCSGSLHLAQTGEKPGEWSAEADVRDAKMTLEALSKPLDVSAARLSVNGSAFAVSHLEAKTGNLAVEGELSFQPGAARPYRLHLSSASVDGGELEALLAPAFRERQGFLQRTLHIGRSATPHWLDNWHAEGVLEAGTLTVNRLAFKKARIGFRWDATEFEARSVSAEVENGALTGALAIGLNDGVPRYKFTGGVDGMRWRGGKSDIDGVAEASGAGAALMKSLRIKANLRSESLDVLAGKDLRTLSARCDINWKSGKPEFRLTDMLVRLQSEELKGSGGTTKDGKLRFDLEGENAKYRIQGDPNPLKLELISNR